MSPQTLVLLSLYSAGRDAANFSQPNTFSPSRWLRDNSPSVLDTLKPQASLPYAIGARSCIGKKIANLQMHTALTKLLTNFELQLLNSTDVRMKLKMVAVPSEKLRIGFKLIRN
jgi:ecdysteroid 2-hydroxylase